ncbi:MAG: glycosyltransferase [Candidatus Aenigmarchaeota archaeon]|nr:glycosyltransferase [Candidatus Aenigmarchaeota archaeon]
MISIIIPCLNEEKYIGKLLGSIYKQTFRKFEVIVVDGRSHDKTVNIAKNYLKKMDLKIIISEKRGIGLQRNLGAKNSKYDRLLFLDSDVILHKDYLKYLETITRKIKLGCATCWNLPITRKNFEIFLYQIINRAVLSTFQKIWPAAIGTNIYSNKTYHNRINGFKENIMWEDVDYIKRIKAKGAKFSVLRKPKIYVSLRRFDKEGAINYITKCIKGFVLVAYGGSKKLEKRIEYKHGIFD